MPFYATPIPLGQQEPKGGSRATGPAASKAQPSDEAAPGGWAIPAGAAQQPEAAQGGGATPEEPAEAPADATEPAAAQALLAPTKEQLSQAVLLLHRQVSAFKKGRPVAVGGCAVFMRQHWHLCRHTLTDPPAFPALPPCLPV